MVIHRSPRPSIALPRRSIAAHFLSGIARWGTRTALIDAADGRELSFVELGGAIRAFAASLVAAGVRSGDVVALWSPNSIEYPIAFHGACLAGAAVCLVPAAATDPEAHAQLDDCAAQWLIVPRALRERAAAVRPSARIVETDALAVPRRPDLPAGELDLPDPAPDSLAALPYSSGTTGSSKGVMLSHYNLVANLEQVQAGEDIGPDDTAIGVLPFFHIYGLTVVMNMTLMRGTRLVVMSRFEPQAFLEALQRHAVTRAYVAPPIVLLLAKHPLVERTDLSALRSIISGAAPLDAGLATECERRTGASVTQGYGLTETSPGVARCSPDDPMPRRPGTIGRLLPDTEARLVDPVNGQDAAPGQPGELWVRGPQVMQGYLGRPDETAAILEAQGWLRTGDLATMSEEGYLTLVDRLKELIKYKGHQVPPSELEAVLLRHPAVRDCAVVGKPDIEAGEVPKAFVVTRSPVDAQTLLDAVAAEVAPYKRVREIEFVDEIPKSPAGKILRRVLVDRERRAG